jgi:hypothetical protein
MDTSKHPSLMEHQHMYKRTWREPAPTLDSNTFTLLWKRQRLAEIRHAVLRGDWPEPLNSDSDSSDDGNAGQDSGSTSCSNSPKPHSGGARSGGHKHHHHHHQHSQDSEEDQELETELQEAADAQLQVVLGRLKEQHEQQLQAARAAAEEVEEQHTATTKQMADIQAQLDELKREKHELFQQLKLVSSDAGHGSAVLQAASSQTTSLHLAVT